MRRGVAVTAAILLVLASGSSAAAQVRMSSHGGSSRPVSFAFGGGASVPVGSYKDALKAGWNGQGSVIFKLGSLPLSLRADLNYNRFTFQDDLTFSSGGNGGTFATSGDITQEILGGLANITIPFHMGAFSPYVTAGLAGFNIKTALGDAVPGADDNSETKFAVNGGIGLSLRLLGASAFIEAKLNNVYADKKFINGEELKALQFVPITFGFVF